MQRSLRPATVVAAAAKAPTHGRYRSLVSKGDWKCLPHAVQLRFDRGLHPGDTVVYRGEVASTERTILGRIWAQLLRFAGAPLPLHSVTHGASVVEVSGGEQPGTQIWTRSYCGPIGKTQIIRSMKSFSGPTGLEEKVGAGLSMALTVSVEFRALVFRSAGYNLRLGRWRLTVPLWLTPGRITVRHREERAGRFSFTLSVVHPWLGRLIHQVAFFEQAR